MQNANANEGQKYCRMLQGGHSAILSTFIKLLFVIEIFVLSIFEWPLKTGCAVCLTLYLLVSSTDKQCKQFGIRPRGYKTFFMLNLTEHGISTAHKD